MYKCLDCGKKLSKQTSKINKPKRCHSCENKRRHRLGIIDSHTTNLKHGKTRTVSYCIDCNNQLNPQAKYYGNIRCRSCSMKYLFKDKTKHPMYGVHRYGKDAPTWIDGRSFESYPQIFTNELKESIRKRDNYECQNCSMTEEEHIEKYKEILNVHHIDYDKKNCKKNNLISLCRKCNLKVNFNRVFWEDYFKLKIKRGGKKL